MPATKVRLGNRVSSKSLLCNDFMTKMVPIKLVRFGDFWWFCPIVETERIRVFYHFGSSSTCNGVEYPKVIDFLGVCGGGGTARLMSL